MALAFKSTAEVSVPEKLIDQVIGQDSAVDIIKKAARQKRHVLLIGAPGTGKSMLAQGMSELMESTELLDVLAYPNPTNENQPITKVFESFPDIQYIKTNGLNRLYTPTELEKIKKLVKNQLHSAIKIGVGRRIVAVKPQEDDGKSISSLIPILVIGLVVGYVVLMSPLNENSKMLITLALLGLGFLFVVSNATAGLGKRLAPRDGPSPPKLIIDNSERNTAPFIDATGSKAGSLLGDVKHDPLQSGGLGTPAHLRVEAGAVHRANNGVLFIDEIASLKMNWQQEILTAMQEKKYPITGQSEMSSGALVKTTPVPTDFVLVAAGNLPDVQHIHPALRSRIRGAGYEVYMEDFIDDTPENEAKLVQFMAQEVKRDGKIPHFDHDAILEMIEEARRMAGRKKKFVLNLRELGGLVRAAGDLARERKLKLVSAKEVLDARKLFRSIESQVGAKVIEQKKEYQTILNTGSEVGRVNGLAVLGDSRAGLVLSIVAQAAPSASKSEGHVIATGKLGTIAKEAVDNVSALFKRYIGDSISKTDMHIQFLQTYEGVEGDSASIAIAVAVISALAEVPVRQDIAMTGSLDVRGKVLPVGGVTGKIEAAIEAGIKKVLIPKGNAEDVYLAKESRGKIEVIPVNEIAEVLNYALADSPGKKKLLDKIKMDTQGN